jgi:hypothetical protein
MMKTLSLLPRNTAHPPLVGKTARTCTSITVLFTSERYPQGSEKQAVCAPCTSSFFPGKHAAYESMKILIVQACMLNTLTEYAFCGIHSPRDLIK